MTKIAIYETERLTAAAEVTVPKAGMYLTDVRLWAGATPGAFSMLYKGGEAAVFPVPSNGTRGHASYKVSYQAGGASLPAALFTFTGGLTVVELQFSDTAPSGHPSIEQYRGLIFRRVDAGAVTADVTVNYAGGDAKPKGIVVHTSASLGRMRFPVTGSYRRTVEAVVSESYVGTFLAPDLGSPSSSLTLSVETDAAQTIQGVVYY